MKHIKILPYSLDLVLSNKYFEVVILSLNPQILNKKVDDSFDLFYFIE